MTVLRGGAHDARLRSADPDRKRLLHRLRRAERVLDAIVLAEIRGAVVPPHSRADLERLDHLRHARRRVGEFVPVGAVFDLLPTRAQPEVEASSAHHVDAGRDFREQGWVAVRLRGDHRADADSVRSHGQCGEKGPGLEAVGVHRVRIEEEMIRDPKPREASSLGVASDREDVLELEAELRLDLNAEIHMPTLAAHRGHRSGGVCSSAVSRNIMCLPVTVSVASMKAAKIAIPTFGIGPSPTTNALKAITSATHTANAKSVSRTWNVIGCLGTRRCGRRSGGSRASASRRLRRSSRMTRATYPTHATSTSASPRTLA